MKNSLTIEETNRFKGLLMILVIIGHLRILTLDYISLLYSFHVSSFLFLPFLFNHDTLNRENIIKIFRRYYIPYAIFFLIALIFYHIFMHTHLDWLMVIEAFVMGTSSYLKESVGLSLYWFFPTLVLLLLFIMLYNSLSVQMKKIALVIMVLLHIVLPLQSQAFFQHTPFNIGTVFYLYIIGFVIAYIYKNYSWRDISTTMYLIILSLLLYFAYGIDYNIAKSIFPNIIGNPINFILHDIIMIVGFFTMLSLSLHLSLLENMGKYSIAIYTIHPFLIQVYYKVIVLLKTEDIYFLKFLFVIALTYMAVIALKKLHLYSYLYPR